VAGAPVAGTGGLSADRRPVMLGVGPDISSGSARADPTDQVDLRR
jgi:hypothetical protein